MADKTRSNVIETECAYCGKYNAVDITDDVAELEEQIKVLKRCLFQMQETAKTLCEIYDEKEKETKSRTHD